MQIVRNSFEINIDEANKALAIKILPSETIASFLLFGRQNRRNSMDSMRQGFKKLMKELSKKPKSYQLFVGAVVGFVVAFPTIQLVKAFAFVLGVIVLGLSIMNKFVLDIPVTVSTPNLHLDRFKSIVMENAIFFTGFTSGYLMGVKFT